MGLEVDPGGLRSAASVTDAWASDIAAPGSAGAPTSTPTGSAMAVVLAALAAARTDQGAHLDQHAQSLRSAANSYEGADGSGASRIAETA